MKLKSFGLGGSGIELGEVGRSFIVEYSYKLLASTYLIYDVGFLAYYDLENLLVASEYLKKS